MKPTYANVQSMQPVTILVTDYTDSDNLTNDLLILSPLIINKITSLTDDAIRRETFINSLNTRIKTF